MPRGHKLSPLVMHLLTASPKQRTSTVFGLTAALLLDVSNPLFAVQAGMPVECEGQWILVKDENGQQQQHFVPCPMLSGPPTGGTFGHAHQVPCVRKPATIVDLETNPTVDITKIAPQVWRCSSEKLACALLLSKRAYRCESHTCPVCMSRRMSVK